MGSHQSASMITEDWLTPPAIIDALGPFDLDPCCADAMPWRTAAHMFTKADDGLSQPWQGRVWLNPPYSRKAVLWLRRMAEHGRGTALTFARTDTRWFRETIWQTATACLFIHQRLFFHLPDGSPSAYNAGAPSVLVAYGEEDARRLMTSGIDGPVARWVTP